MRRFLTILILFVATAAQADDTPTVLIFGDSLSAGYGLDVDQSWGALLQQRLEEQGYEHRVVNASISGETTEGGVTQIDNAITTFSPALIILELGGNDGLRGYPTDLVRQNLKRMVELALTGDRRVLLVGMQIPPNYGPRYTRAFYDVYASVAEETGVSLVPFFLDRVALEPGFMQSDGIHPTAAAQPLLLETLWNYLEPLLAP